MQSYTHLSGSISKSRLMHLNYSGVVLNTTVLLIGLKFAFLKNELEISQFIYLFTYLLGGFLLS